MQEQEATLPGTVKLLFQPAEEGGAGADVMVHEGEAAALRLPPRSPSQGSGSMPMSRPLHTLLYMLAQTPWQQPPPLPTDAFTLVLSPSRFWFVTHSLLCRPPDSSMFM